MATISLSGSGQVTITFADGTSFASNETITKDTAEPKAIAAVTKAMNGAFVKYKGNTIKENELDGINAAAETRRLLKKLNESVKVEPRVEAPPPTRVEPARPEPEKQPPRREARARLEPQPAVQPPRRVEPPPRVPPSPVERRAPVVAPPKTPKPRIDRMAILAQIGARDQAKAATFLVTNREEINRYLQAGQKGTERTRTQREATIKLFNELSRIPAFRLYLSSIANPEVHLEFAELEAFLGQHSKIDDAKTAQILAYADLYIMYYLANHAVKDPNFKREFEQLFTRTGKDDLRGPVDSDTIAAAELHIRRWNQNKSLKSDLPAWIPPAEKIEEKRIAIIGSSMVGQDRGHPSVLGSTFQGLMIGVVVDSYGIKEQNLTAVARRFKADIIDGEQKYNTVVISGQSFANNPDFQLSKGAFEQMIKQAREAGIKVIVTGVMPYGGYRGCSQKIWEEAERVNRWLATVPGITYIDLRSLGDNNNPPRLRPEFTDRGSDGLHSNLAREETARLIAEKLGATVPPSKRVEDEPALEQPGKDAERVSAPLPEPPTVKATPLQIFAQENWTRLREDLRLAVEQKNPAEIIRLARIALPQGQSSLEKVLADLTRNDIQLAFKDVFRNLNSDEEFKTFVKSKKYNLFGGKNLVELPEGTSTRDIATVRLASRAVQEYMKTKTESNADFGGDVKKLQGRIGGTLGSTPDNLILTLSTIAVHRWRLENPTKEIGEWGKNVGIKPEKPLRHSLF